jgi:surface antigen
MSQYPCFAQAPDSACPATPHYPARECTSYADWRASLILGHGLPDWGDGGQWAGNARAAGFTVDGRPAVNAIMALGNNVNGAGPQGHVAWVIGVETQTVNVAEYNFLVEHGYDERDAQIAGAQFIHLPTPPAPPVPSPITGDPAMFLYQAANGTIYLVQGGVKLTFTNVADVEKYQAQGVKLYLASEFSAEWNAVLAGLPVTP